MKPRVLHVCSDTNIGGAGRYVLTLLTQPRIAERFVVAVACPEGDLAVTLRRAGLEVLTYPGADVSFSLAALQSLYLLVRSWRPQIVHTHGSLAGRVAAGVAGVKVVYTKHGLASVAEQAVQVRRARATVKRAAVRVFADRIVAVSEAVKRSLVAAGADAERVWVIPGGVALDGYVGVPPLVPGVVGALGRLSFEKGFDVLVDAVPRLAGAGIRVLLAGDGPQREALSRQVADLGLSEAVSLVGFVDAVPAFLGRTGVFVLPSRSEGLGLVLVEAMAAGRPVVATRVGGIPEVVVDGETGFLVEPEDAGALAGAIARVLGDPALAFRLGEAGRRRAQAVFSAERMADQMAALYAELVHS